MGRDFNYPHSIPNAWMAATPGHPFFLLPLEFVVHKYETDENAKDIHVEDLTGPIALREQIAKYNEELQGEKMDQHISKSPMNDRFKGAGAGSEHRVEVLPHQMIYPYSWAGEDDSVRPWCWAKEASYDPTKCKEKLHLSLQGSVAISFWQQSW